MTNLNKLTNKLPLPKNSGLTTSTNSHILNDSDTVSVTVEQSLSKTSMSELYDFSDIQKQALISSIKVVFNTIHERFEHAYNHSVHGENHKKRKLISLSIDFEFLPKPISIVIFNTFMSFGEFTSLQLSIPISLFYKSYLEELCKLLNIENTPSSRKALKEHFTRPTKANIICYFKSLSQSSILCATQRSDANISSRLNFSINDLYLKKFNTNIDE